MENRKFKEKLCLKNKCPSFSIIGVRNGILCRVSNCGERAFECIFAQSPINSEFLINFDDLFLK